MGTRGAYSIRGNFSQVVLGKVSRTISLRRYAISERLRHDENVDVTEIDLLIWASRV